MSITYTPLSASTFLYPQVLNQKATISQIDETMVRFKYKNSNKEMQELES